MTRDVASVDPSTATDTDGAGLAEPAGVGYLVERSQVVSLPKVLGAGPRTVRFLLRSTTRDLRHPEQLTHPDIPTRLPTMATAAGVWLDELFLAVMASTRLGRTEAELDRIADEVHEALEILEAAGALDRSEVLHPAPAPASGLQASAARYRNIRYHHITFPSDYRPALELPGTERWNRPEANRTAHAYVLRHREPRPWLVQLHGFGMGKPSDLVAMRALHFHRDLGLNVIHPVFPVHGPRAAGDGDEEPLTTDYLNNVHAFSQAIADVRTLLGWINGQQPDQPVAVHGVSMGGYLASLLVGLHDGIDAVITGVPTVDLAWVMNRHLPEEDRTLVDERGLLGATADRIHSVVSPLAVQPNVPFQNRFIYAGVADRMSTPGQAHRLWDHWGQPAVLWYRGAHVSFAWSREVRRFVDRAIRKTVGAHGSAGRRTNGAGR